MWWLLPIAGIAGIVLYAVTSADEDGAGGTGTVDQIMAFSQRHELYGLWVADMDQRTGSDLLDALRAVLPPDTPVDRIVVYEAKSDSWYRWQRTSWYQDPALTQQWREWRDDEL